MIKEDEERYSQGVLRLDESLRVIPGLSLALLAKILGDFARIDGVRVTAAIIRGDLPAPAADLRAGGRYLSSSPDDESLPDPEPEVVPGSTAGSFQCACFPSARANEVPDLTDAKSPVSTSASASASGSPVLPVPVEVLGSTHVSSVSGLLGSGKTSSGGDGALALRINGGVLPILPYREGTGDAIVDPGCRCCC